MNENKPKKWEWKKVTHKEKNKTSLDKNKKLLSAPTNMNLIVIAFPLLCRLEEKKRFLSSPPSQKLILFRRFKAKRWPWRKSSSLILSLSPPASSQRGSLLQPSVRASAYLACLSARLSVCPSHLCNLRGYEHTHGQKRKAKKKRGEKLLWLNPRTKLFSFLAICTYKDTIPD